MAIFVDIARLTVLVSLLKNDGKPPENIKYYHICLGISIAILFFLNLIIMKNFFPDSIKDYAYAAVLFSY